MESDYRCPCVDLVVLVLRGKATILEDLSHTSLIVVLMYKKSYLGMAVRYDVVSDDRTASSRCLGNFAARSRVH